MDITFRHTIIGVYYTKSYSTISGDIAFGVYDIWGISSLGNKTFGAHDWAQIMPVFKKNACNHAYVIKKNSTMRRGNFSTRVCFQYSLKKSLFFPLVYNTLISPDFADEMATSITCKASAELPILNQCQMRIRRLFHYCLRRNSLSLPTSLKRPHSLRAMRARNYLF